MANLDTLIDELAQDKAYKAMFNPAIVFLKWILCSVFYGGVLISILGIRPDFSEMLYNHFYTAELALLGMILVLSLFSCVNLALPDINQKKYSIYLGLMPLVALLFLISSEFLAASNGVVAIDMGGLECTTCITLSSLVPGLFLFYEVRKAAPTRTKLAGFFCLTYAASLGAFILRLSEKQDSVIHLLVWHYLPVVLIGLLGALIGKKMFKW